MRLILLLITAALASAADLSKLKPLLRDVELDREPFEKTRGANPNFAQIKRILREWLDERIAESASPTALPPRLNRELADAVQACPACLRPVRIEGVQGAANYVVARTYVAIECGLDESAYLYERTGEKWVRRTDVEVALYTPEEYQPQRIAKISLSEQNSGGERAFSVLGVKQWCSSDWQEVYLRVYRIGPRGSTLVASESRPAYLGFDINTRAEPDEAWFEFSAQSIDDGVLTRTVVYHYRVIGAAADRIQPVALTPRDFAEEWLTRSWSEAQRWSDPHGNAELHNWHRKLHAESISADFTGMWRCEGTSPEYMIQFDDFDRHLGAGYERIGTVVLLIREEADHRFTMVDVGTEGWTDCADPVQHPRARPTLFPK